MCSLMMDWFLRMDSWFFGACLGGKGLLDDFAGSLEGFAMVCLMSQEISLS